MEEIEEIKNTIDKDTKLQDFVIQLYNKYKDSPWDVSGTDLAEDVLYDVIIEYYEKLKSEE